MVLVEAVAKIQAHSLHKRIERDIQHGSDHRDESWYEKSNETSRSRVMCNVA